MINIPPPERPEYDEQLSRLNGVEPLHSSPPEPPPKKKPFWIVNVLRIPLSLATLAILSALDVSGAIIFFGVVSVWQGTTHAVLATLNGTHAGYATTSLALGIAAVIVGLLSPIVGIVLSLFGIGYGIAGVESANRGRALAGIVLSTLGIVVAIVSWVFSVLIYLWPFDSGDVIY